MKQVSLFPLLCLLLSCGSSTEERHGSGPVSSPGAQSQAAGTVAAAPEEEEQTYCNQRFGFCITYDGRLLDAQPEADSRDGRIFLDKRGHEFLRVYGRANSDAGSGQVTMEEALEERYRDLITGDRDGRTPIYKKSGKGFVVFSAAKHDTIYYTKVIQAGKDLAFADFRYAAKDKERYDPVITRMAGTFKPAGNGY